MIKVDPEKKKSLLKGCFGCDCLKDSNIISTGQASLNPGERAVVKCSMVADGKEFIRPVSSGTKPDECKRYRKGMRKISAEEQRRFAKKSP